MHYSIKSNFAQYDFFQVPEIVPTVSLKIWLLNYPVESALPNYTTVGILTLLILIAPLSVDEKKKLLGGHVCSALFKLFPRQLSRHVTFNTSYLTDSYIIFTIKMESVSKNTIFGLKMIVKSGLEKIFLKFIHAGDYFFLTSKKCPKLQSQ